MKLELRSKATFSQQVVSNPTFKNQYEHDSSRVAAKWAGDNNEIGQRESDNNKTSRRTVATCKSSLLLQRIMHDGGLQLLSVPSSRLRDEMRSGSTDRNRRDELGQISLQPRKVDSLKVVMLNRMIINVITLYSFERAPTSQ